jgi:hypothetical protein
MSDFDEVLERLLSDPSFQTALARDPGRALAGYQLDPHERELLKAQMDTGTGQERTVETRTTKSGVVGLLGSATAAFGLAAGGQGSAPSGHQILGSAPSGNQDLGSASGSDTFGSAPTSAERIPPGGDKPTESFGSAGPEKSPPVAPGGESFGTAPVEARGYETRIDVDGDGRWDAHQAYERSDGGVDIHVDTNKDGVADFIGHDYDRDGLVDAAEVDTNRDGTLDTRMYDDNGDGWLDRSEAIPPSDPGGQTFGQAPASS